MWFSLITWCTCNHFLPTALSACRTGMPNVWLHHQVSFWFAEKEIFVVILYPMKPKLLAWTNPSFIANSKTQWDLLGLRLRAGSAAPGCQRWIWEPCVQRGFLSAPPSLLAAAGGAEENKDTDTRCWRVCCVRIQMTAPCHTPTCTLGSCGAPGGTWAWLWDWGASTGNPITGAVMGAGGV